MAEIPVPITTGSGAASIAADVVSNISYQQIKVVDGTLGSNTALKVNPDGSFNASIIGLPQISISGGSVGLLGGTANIGNVGIAGSVAAYIIGGSIAGTFTTPNQSVSGTVGASIIGLTPIAISGYPSVLSNLASIAGSFLDDQVNTATRLANGSSGQLFVPNFNYQFNGGTWDRMRGNSSVGTFVSTGASSVITISQGSIAAVIIGGSITASFTPAGNQSVSGTVGASIIGLAPVSVSNFPTTQNVSGSVVATQGTNPWLVAPNNSSIFALQVAGSVLAVSGSFTPAANQSVSGTVGASIIGQLPGGTAVLGSVAALQGTNPWIVTSSVAGGLFPISGSVAATIVNFPTTQNVSGSVVSFQGGAWAHTNIGSVITISQGSVATVIIGGSIAASFTPPANQSVSGTVQTDVRGSVAVAIISGSIAATFTPPANQSVSGTVNIGTGGPVSVVGTMSVLGTVPVTQSTTPWIITGSVQGSFSPAANQSVSGTVGASIIGQLPAGTAVLGSIATLQGTNPWIVVSSLAGGIFPISGSVAATIVGQPITVTPNFSSILAVPVGSTIAVLQAPSIVGTYAEDAGSTSGDKGLFVLGVRNDTLASVTSTDLDYGTYTIGPSGEQVTANAPYTKWISGQTSIMYGASVALIPAQGTSIFTYITGVQIANMSANNALITFQGASSSTIGFTIAPATGGSNIVFPNALKTNANGAFTASIGGVASVYLSAQGFIAKI